MLKSRDRSQSLVVPFEDLAAFTTIADRETGDYESSDDHAGKGTRLEADQGREDRSDK